MVLGLQICRGGNTPRFEHAFLNRTCFQACGLFWLSSVQRAARVAGEKKKIEDRVAVIYLSPPTSMLGGLNNRGECKVKLTTTSGVLMIGVIITNSKYFSALITPTTYTGQIPPLSSNRTELGDFRDIFRTDPKVSF